MKVNTEQCNTVEEELAHIEKQISKVGNFFACDVHENAVRAADATMNRLWRKQYKLKTSPEFIYYHLSNNTNIQLDEETKELLGGIDPYKE